MWNNCCCNHPCPIFCGRLEGCTNDVINPVLRADFGFFNNINPQTVAADSIIQVAFVLGEGTSIVSSTSTSGAVTLAQGTYEISYFANVTLPESGTASIAMTLNGTLVSGSMIDVTGDSGQIVSVSQTVMINVLQASTLALINAGSDPVVIDLASLSIKKL